MPSKESKTSPVELPKDSNDTPAEKQLNLPFLMPTPRELQTRQKFQKTHPMVEGYTSDGKVITRAVKDEDPN